MHNLKAIIEEGSANKAGGFTGAVFLTFTLDLGFFEQIILPALERAGCSNVLIITDPDGYVEAIERGMKKVSFAGLRYVCTPLPRKTMGVQHAKMLIMVGQNRGRLLIGSGNLTYFGFSRNVEVYSHFEYDKSDPKVESQLALSSAWRLIKRFSNDQLLPSTAQTHLDVISEKADWLSYDSPERKDFQIWDNYENSIWSQFLEWRDDIGLKGNSCKELKIFSPYYDQNVGMLRKVQDQLLPDQLKLYLSKDNTTFNNQAVLNSAIEGRIQPVVFDTHGLSKKQAKRLLHAKLIVGVEETCSWCIAGSANMTIPALDKSWVNGANLELVVFRWSHEQVTFDYLLDESLSIEEINADSILFSNNSNFSEEPKKVFQGSIFIDELVIKNKTIEGQLNYWPSNESKKVDLFFLKSGERILVELDENFSFKSHYEKEISDCEAVKIIGKNNVSFPRWIDVPEILRAYGSRSYRANIEGKLDSISGVETLFHELLDFLFDRVSPENISKNIELRRSSKRSGKGNDNNSKSQESVPADAVFIVPETDESGNYIIDKYTQHHYETNIHSLRDLLSIVLLKLTDPPQLSSEIKIDENGKDDEGDVDENENYIQDQINARKRLCAFLIGYCKRYSQKLCQNDFIEIIPPVLLLDNHLTLSRVLLEFKDLVEEFSQSDLEKCYWLMWAPFFWPDIIDIEGTPTLDIYKGIDKYQEFISSWNELNVSIFFKAVTSTVFGQPPSWSFGLHAKDKVIKFLTLNKLVNLYNSNFDIEFDDANNQYSIGLSHIDWDICVNYYQKISSYLPPAKERLLPIINWVHNQDDPVLMKKCLLEINQNNLQKEFEAYRNNPKEIRQVLTEPDDERNVYCSRCFASLREKSVSDINKGKLVLCSTNSDVWLYKGEKIPEKIIL